MTAEDPLRGTLAELTDRIREEGSRRRARNSRLIDAVRALDGATSLSDVLETLARSAGRESPRAGVLLVRDGLVRGWCFSGFDAPPLEPARVELPLADAGVIGEAVSTRSAASASDSASAPAFASDLPDGRERFSVPLLVAGEVVAVVYADQGPAPVPDAGEADEEWQVAIEVLARHAARCLEAVTAFKTARFLAEHTKPNPTRPPTDGIAQAWPPGVQAADEEQAARRYARLLVSEIKLYHEAALVAGRRERDLASRLGGEIAHARALYEQRVSDEVRRGTDHFRAELVRTLADGDASLLGTSQVERST